MELLGTSIRELLESIGLHGPAAVLVERLVILTVVVLLAVLANWVGRRLIVRFLHAMFRRSKASWDDVIADRGVLLRLSRVAPALIVYFSGDLIAPELPWVGELVRRVSTAWVVLAATFTIDSSIDVFHDLYRETVFSKKRPIKGFVQLGKVVLFIVAGVMVITTILNQSPVGILGGLGAMSAVLLLIFRDSILGFVSGIQLSANNMVQIGDWIEMPKYDANGDSDRHHPADDQGAKLGQNDHLDTGIRVNQRQFSQLARHERKRRPPRQTVD